jgi:cation transport protein ChaC
MRIILKDEISAAQKRAGKGPLFVFAYGSLMWSPGFAHRDWTAARIFGYARRLCVYSTVYRGNPASPGLVFGLAAGGSCRGVVYTVAAADKDAALRYLFRREMFAGVYRPRFVIARREKKPPVRALAFVARDDHPNYAGDVPAAAARRIILSAKGKNGTCLEYVRESVRHLREMGIDLNLPGIPFD